MPLSRLLSSPSLWRVLVLLWFGVLFWLSSQSHLPSPASFEGVDKLEHAIFFSAGGMCFLLGLRLAGFAKATQTAILVTVLFCGAVGGFDEWHQTYTPGRSGGDVWDWTADMCGGFLGAFLAMGFQRWLGRGQLEA
ncbi:MAG: VanZ family protein [Prosthecobacter sp.]|uniref:VanZ family protein n=1 Tax=Prosthecobacter sp. TaxID=1965333 RepID=UPI0025E91DAD|nr:VanZ family protein [Prosthecobacter sp.]MCF7785305.1 VanZ family protein [Prosthecobacter sp.]